MTATYEQTEAELELLAKRAQAFDRITRGGLSREEEALQRKLLGEYTEAIMALQKQREPPPKDPIIKNIRELTPAQAAAEAAKLRAHPCYFGGPGSKDADGRTMSKLEYETMVQAHGEFMARAGETDSAAGG